MLPALDLLAGSQSAEFSMVSLQKILADDGKLQFWNRLPGQAQVQFAVGREALIGDQRDITKRAVELKMGRQIQRRSEKELTIRIVRFAAAVGGVGAARFGLDVSSQFR